MLRNLCSSRRYACGIVRSTPEQDERLRLRLVEAVDKFAGSSADKFGQMIGYANGGYVRECINKKKPVRETIIDRVHTTEGMAGWFSACLTPISAGDVAESEERDLLTVFLALPPGSAARREVLGFARGIAAATRPSVVPPAIPARLSPMNEALKGDPGPNTEPLEWLHSSEETTPSPAGRRGRRSATGHKLPP